MMQTVCIVHTFLVVHSNFFFHSLVLTKVIVYAGIAVLASEVLPLVFDLMGWGVKSRPVVV